MADNENVAYISTDFGHKNSARNENMILEGRKTKNVNTIATDFENHRS